jgi:hypothetical protein
MDHGWYTCGFEVTHPNVRWTDKSLKIRGLFGEMNSWSEGGLMLQSTLN